MGRSAEEVFFVDVASLLLAPLLGRLSSGWNLTGRTIWQFGGIQVFYGKRKLAHRLICHATSRNLTGTIICRFGRFQVFYRKKKRATLLSATQPAGIVGLLPIVTVGSMLARVPLYTFSGSGPLHVTCRNHSTLTNG